MALLLSFAPPCPLSPSSSSRRSSSSSSATVAVNVASRSRLHIKPVDLDFLVGFCFDKPFSASRRVGIVAKADIEETGSDGEKPVSESDDGDEENIIPFEKIPLESKLQLKLEQKMRMKVAKKIRLRRKKLIRKRRMRKKGRWPPSKMKKLKNV